LAFVFGLLEVVVFAVVIVILEVPWRSGSGDFGDEPREELIHAFSF
jgi:hypothetical protein